MAWKLVAIEQKNSETVETLKHSVRETDLEQLSWEEFPALYFMAEILALKCRSPEELQEIHRYKLTYTGARLIQEGAEGKGGHG